MKNRHYILIAVVVVIGLAVLIFLVSRMNNGHHYHWQEDYKTDDKNPYGIGICQELLKSYHPNKAFEEIKVAPAKFFKGKTSEQNANYVFIGNEIFLSPDDLASLYLFVRSGNDALVASHEFPEAINEFLFSSADEKVSMGGMVDSTIEMQFRNPHLRRNPDFHFHYQLLDTKWLYYWNYFRSYPESFPMPVAVLGTLSDSGVEQPNYLRFDIGKGHLYLHSNPIVFTNYYLIEKEGKEYSSRVFSQLKPGAIYFDNYSRVMTAPKNNDNPSQPDFGSSSFSYLLSQPALRYMLYLCIAAVLLFVFFHAKRQSRPLEVMEPNLNTSLSFVQTIGRLYFMQRNYVQLSDQMYRMFVLFVKNRYFIQLGADPQESLRLLAAKSQLPEERIQDIFTRYRNIKGYAEIELWQMVQFHQALEEFYKNCH